MIQSMEILQLPVLELQERIDQEMTENPVLEELEQEQLELEGAEALEAAEQSTQDEGEQELIVDEDSNNAEDFERLDDLDLDSLLALLPQYFDAVLQNVLFTEEADGAGERIRDFGCVSGSKWRR